MKLTAKREGGRLLALGEAGRIARAWDWCRVEIFRRRPNVSTLIHKEGHMLTFDTLPSDMTSLTPIVAGKKKRIAGLNRGTMKMAEDFNAPIELTEISE